MPYTDSELGRLLAEVRRPFQAVHGRDALLDSWRAVRHRRAMPWLPPNIQLFGNAQVLFRDPMPGFIIDRIKNRLGANDLDIAIHPRGDAGPELQRKQETLEDWFRGVTDMLDPLGRVDSKLREHQAADGVAFAKLEFLPNWVPPKRDSRDDKAYDAALDQSRREYGLPALMSAPDPRSLYYVEANDQLRLVCEVLNVPLVDIQNKWSPEGIRLGYRGGIDAGPLTVDQVVVGEGLPPSTVAEWGRMCRLVIIADHENIYHCVYPNTVPSGSPFDDGQGSPPQLVLLATYPNPLGRPPYFMAPARTTSDPDPAYRHPPLALEPLEMAPYINQTTTIRMIRAYLDALKPVHARPAVSGGDNAAPANMPDLWRPGFLQWDGSFAEIPTTQIPDFDKLVVDLKTQEQSYNLSIMGALQSGAIGRNTPAWSISQLNEDQVGMLQEALDSRAILWRDVLLAVRQLCIEKYAKGGPVYVNSRALNRSKPEQGLQDFQVGATSELLESSFRLSVTIDALTQSQRAANTEYHRRLWMEGRYSDQTYDEMIGIKDRVAEEARRNRQALMAPMKAVSLGTAWEMFKVQMRLIYGPIADTVFAKVGGPGGAPPVQAAPPDAMAAELAAGPGMPGQGMSDMQPEPSQFQRNGNYSNA